MHHGQFEHLCSHPGTRAPPPSIDSHHSIISHTSPVLWPLSMKVATASLLSIPLFISQLTTAVSLQCDNVQLDKKKFDLSKLSGRHSVWVHDTSRPPAEYNTTWTINLCQPLEKLDGIPSRNQCPAGTRGVFRADSLDPPMIVELSADPHDNSMRRSLVVESCR